MDTDRRNFRASCGRNLTSKIDSSTGAFRCYSCNATWVQWGAWCRACGAVDAVAFDPEADAATAKNWNEEEQVNEDGPIAAGDVIPTQKLAIPTGLAGLDLVLAGGYYKEVTGGTIRGSAVLFTGPRGCGKSRLTLASLSRPAKSRLKVLYVSAEEVTERLSTYVRADDLSPKIGLYNTTDFDRALELAEEGSIDILAIDSAQKMKVKGRRALNEISERVRDFASSHPTIIILLSQENRAGDPAGTNELGHDLDVVLKLARDADGTRILTCDNKNRFGRDDGQWRYRIVEKKNGTRLVTVADPLPPEPKALPALPPAAPPRPPMPRPPPLPQPPPRRPLSRHPGLHIVPSRPRT
jgi:DNA repair protein RadA/Sms